MAKKSTKKTATKTAPKVEVKEEIVETPEVAEVVEVETPEVVEEVVETPETESALYKTRFNYYWKNRGLNRTASAAKAKADVADV